VVGGCSARRHRLRRADSGVGCRRGSARVPLGPPAREERAMTPLLFVLASVAGGVGAGLRSLVDVGIAALTKGRFPWGIVIVNITGSFTLGFVTASIPEAGFVVGAGLLGG